ncbi:MAG: lysylphosphatidylglycerol synthase transmembrane domain-containing protein [Solirubrobacteraceae bacterium]
MSQATVNKPAPPSRPASGAVDHPHGGHKSPGRRRLIVTAVLIVLSIVALYLLLPKLVGLNKTWGRLKHGDPVWLAAAAAVELLSIAGYALLFRTVFGRGMRRLGWAASIQIPLAGIAAIRLFAAAGAGGVAVTAWALVQAGMERRVVACRMVANLVIQYAVYLFALALFGFAVGLGVLPGHGPFELTLLPAVLSIVLAAIALSAVLLPTGFERRLRQMDAGPRWWRRLVERAAAAPTALGDGTRTAVSLIAERRPGLIGAVLYWGFDIAALGFSFRAFGSDPQFAIIVLGYFLGTLGSLLPLPGGIGGVEGAMIGSFVAFGVPATQAVVGVLAYRAISFWLPTLPGIAGYVALRRTVHRWERQRS